MRKFSSRLTIILWALVVVFLIKGIAVNHGLYNFDISINFKDPFGYLFPSQC